MLLALPINTGGKFATETAGRARQNAIDGDYQRLD